MCRLYFLTSYHYNPGGVDVAPLCLVWIGLDRDHSIITGKIYQSYNFPKMLSLAHKIAQTYNLPLSVLSSDLVIEVIYSRERDPS